jgi:hypothetical protein
VFAWALNQFPQSLSGGSAVDFTRGHIQDEPFPIVDRQFRARQNFVGFQKNQASGERGAFVPVNKRMIAANVKEIRRPDLDRIRDERLAHHRGLRRGNGRFKQCFIANTSRAAVGSKHFTVNRFDGSDRQMLERLAQDKRLNSAAFFLISRLAVLAAVSESIDGWIGVKTIEPPGCTVTLT